MIPQGTRGEILQLLKRHRGLTIAQLARELGISPMAVRQHLMLLEGEGLVEGEKIRGRVGRPGLAYRLTRDGDEIFPRRYDVLAETLLDAVAELHGPETVDALFRKRMERQLARYSERLGHLDLPERVRELARIQADGGYMAEPWRSNGNARGEHGFVQYNCPIALIARRYPVACHYELELYCRLLGAPVERVECIAQGGTCCRYRIGNGLPVS